MPAKFAEGTTVSPGQSREEISKLLRKYGAGKFAYMDDENESQAIVGFELRGRTYRFIIRLPAMRDFVFTTTGKRRSEAQIKVVHNQAVKEHWRAMVAVIKGKLIAIENGIETFEEVFLKYAVVPGSGGQTVGEMLEPQLQEAYATGKMPPLLPSGQ